MASTKTESDTSWATPHVFTAGELVTSTIMNGLKDNVLALKDPAYGVADIDEASDYTTTSTAWVDVDGAGNTLTLEIETGGGNVLIGFNGVMRSSSASYYIKIGVDVDGTPVAADDGIYSTNSTEREAVSFTWLVTGLSAGTHTFVLRWKMSSASGTGTLYAGAGTTDLDTHPQFWVMEV